jgi:hypothetical protein
MIYLAIGHRTRIAWYNAGTYHRSQALAMQRLDLHAMQNAGFVLPPQTMLRSDPLTQGPSQLNQVYLRKVRGSTAVDTSPLAI